MAQVPEAPPSPLPALSEQAGPSWRRARAWLVVALIGFLVEVSTDFLPLTARTQLALHDGLQLAAAMAAAVACFLAGRQATGNSSKGWLLLGAAASLWAVGQAIWSWYEVVLGIPVPFPGWADAGYLATYPFAIAGLMLLTPLSGRGWVERSILVFDGALAALAVSVLAWPLFLHGAFQGATSDLGAYVTVAYPLADILLLSLVGGMLMRIRSVWRSALGIAYVAFWFVFLADLGYAAGILEGTYATGHFLDSGWIVGFLVLAAAARAPLPSPEGHELRSRYIKSIGYAMPVAAVLTGLGAFALGQWTGDTGSLSWRFSLGALFVAALARQMLAGLEHVGLERARQALESSQALLFANMTEAVAHCRVLYEHGKAVDWEYLYVNAQFGPLTGLHDVVGKRVSQVIPGFQEANAEMLALFGRVAHGGPPETIESHVPGLARWFTINAYAAGPDEFIAVFDNTTERKAVEERLRFKARLLASVGQAVVATDLSGRITYWGAGAVALYGWTADEVLGRSIVEVTPSQTSRARAEEIMASLASGKAWSGEFVVRRKDGSSFTALVNNTPILEDGRLVGVISVSQDISGMKQLELDLRERMKELRALSAVATASAQAGAVGPLLDTTVRALEKAFLHDDPWIKVSAGGLQATSDGPEPQGQEIRSQFQSVNGEGAIVARYRSAREARDDGPFLREERALLDSLANLLRTVIAEKAAAERVSFQAHLLESVSQAVVATNLEGRVNYWNPAAEKLFGWSNAEAVGRPVVDLWGDLLVLSPHQDANEAAPTGDYPMRRKDGSPILVNLGTSPLLSPTGALEGFIAVGQDATEARAQTIALRRRERALTMISAVNEVLIRADTEAGLLKAICDIAVVTGGYQMTWVGIARDTPGHPIEPVAWAGHEAGYIKALNVTWDNLPRGQVTGKSIRESRTVVMRDLAHNPAFAPWRDQALANGYASAIALFLPLGDERGAMVMYAGQPDAFTADEVTLLEEMAGDLAFGIRTLRLKAKESTLTAMLNDAEELSKMGSWAYDAATRKVTWSDEVYRIHEVPESYDPGDAARDIHFYEGEDEARVDTAFRAAVERGVPYDLEVALRTARGRLRDVRVLGMPEMKEGNVIRVHGNIMDITDQKRRQEDLRLSEARLREAQATAHLGSWELGTPEGKFVGSDEFWRIFEIDRARLPATYETIMGAVHPEDRERVGKAFRTASAAGAPHSVSHRLLMPDGRVKHVLAQGRTELGPDGQPTRTFGTVLDVTEATLLQQALQASEDTNRRFVEESPLAIVRVSRDGQFLAGNPAAVKLYGVPDVGALLKCNARNFYVRPEEREQRLAEAESPRGQDNGVTELRRQDGTRFWVRSHSHAVRDADGKVAYYEGIVEDITVQRRADEARQELENKASEVKRLEALNKMRMDFLNTAAHDLKTPLTPLKLQMATLRLRGNLDPKQKDSLDLMDRNVARFQVLVDDMLDAARLQAGKLKLRRAAVELGPLVQEAVASFQEAARAEGLQMEVALAPRIIVDADSSKLMQVLMNLVSNAVKYTAKGGGVQVRLAGGGEQAHLSITDTGLGMTAEQLARLFQPFVRLHEGQAGVAGGTGLGLYICKGIAEQHGGRIWAESTGPGHGSTFHLEWPLAKAVTAAAPAANGNVNDPTGT